MKVTYKKNFSQSRNKIILNYCKWKKVLHIWACDSPFTEKKYNWNSWPLLYREIDNICNEQLWIDLDKNSIDFLNSKNEFKKSKIIFFDMNKLESLNFQPDIIIFWEVIEHLMNLEIALTNLKNIMNKNTLLIISTPNAFCINYFINILRNVEYVHEDHKVIFSTATLNNLLNSNWLDIEKIYYTLLDEDKNKLSMLWKIERTIKQFIMKRKNGFASTLLYIVKKWK